MANPWGGGSAGSSAWGGGGSSSSKKPKKDGGVLGLVENLAGDVKDSIVGLPAGLVMAAKHPIETVKLTANAEWQQWSPLFKGDVKEFGHRFYEHPLGPLLDVSALFTGGASLAGKGAKIATEAGLASEGGRVARLAKFSEKGAMREYPDLSGKNRPTQYKKLPSNPLHRARSNAVNAGLAKLEASIGEYMPKMLRYESRFAKKERRHKDARAAAKMATIAMYVEGGRKIDDPVERKIAAEAVLEHQHKEWQFFAHKHDITKPIPAGYAPLKAHDKSLYRWDDKLGDFEAHMREAPKRFLGSRKETNRLIRDLNKQANPKVASGQSVEKWTAAKADKAAERRLKQGEKLAQMEAKKQGLMLDGEGKYVYIVPKHMAEKSMVEAFNSSQMLRAMYKHPTTIWKTIMLGYRPAFFVNNFVGNHFMYLMDQGLGSGIRGYVDALRQVRSEKAVQRSLKTGLEKTQAIMASNGDVVQRWFKDQLGNHMVNEVLGAAMKGADHGKIGKVARTGFFGVTQAYTDEFVRRATISNILRELPEVKAAAARGEDIWKTGGTLDKLLAQDALQNGGKLRRQISENVMDVMGDYHSFTGAEKAVKELVPFYAWDRHITRHMVKMLQEKPATVAAAAGLGRQGEQEIEQIMGEIPNFMKGSIPLTMLGLHFDHPSRIANLSTSGLNPYATGADLLEAGLALTGKGKLSMGETVASNFNPILGGIIEKLSGHDLATGMPTKGGLADVYPDIFKGLTHYKLVKSLTNPDKPKPNKRTGKTTPFLNEHSPTEYLLSLLGAPVKQTNTKRAKEYKHRQERG